MAMIREDALRKVRSLLRVAAEGSGATEPERQNALGLIDQMILRHGLSAREVIATKPGKIVVNVSGIGSFNFGEFQ